MMGIASLLKEEVSSMDLDGQQDATPPHNAAPIPSATIHWTTFNPTFAMAERNDGVEFSRGTYGGHDAALGQVLTVGRHEWIVNAPNWTPNQYIGVADGSCDVAIYPRATSAWTLYLHDGDLCSGVARFQGRRAKLATKGVANQYWMDMPCPINAPIRVVLNMDARTLSFAIGDEEPQLAYTNLPGNLHPYICSGEKQERSLLIAY